MDQGGLSVAELLILITGTISALASAFVTVMTARSANTKLEAIKKSTDGNLTAVTTELAGQKGAVEALHRALGQVADEKAKKP